MYIDVRRREWEWVIVCVEEARAQRRDRVVTTYTASHSSYFASFEIFLRKSSNALQPHDAHVFRPAARRPQRDARLQRRSFRQTVLLQHRDETPMNTMMSSALRLLLLPVGAVVALYQGSGQLAPIPPSWTLQTCECRPRHRLASERQSIKPHCPAIMWLESPCMSCVACVCLVAPLLSLSLSLVRTQVQRGDLPKRQSRLDAHHHAQVHRLELHGGPAGIPGPPDSALADP